MNQEYISIKDQLDKVKEKISALEPITLEQVREVLNLTIKKDDENKMITFLGMLSAYTDNAQFNISFNAPSSSGKSFIPIEVSNLFPKEDVMKLGSCSPSAFFHENGIYNKETNERFIDLSRKIILFLDMPHTSLFEKLRSMLSHDEKEMRSKITDKSEKGGNRTKTVVIRGFPSVIFCTANLRIDEQETTRFILLSPQIDPDKIRAGIHQAIRKESDNKKYYQELMSNPLRKALMDRIVAIKAEGITEIKIENEGEIEKRFLANVPMPKPRNQRDVKRLLSIIKSITLLNIWSRKREGNTLIASEYDIDSGFELWNKISLCQELQIPPYIYELYERVIMPLWNEPQTDEFGDPVPSDKRLGISRREISMKHYQIYGRPVDELKLRQSILPTLEIAGLIYQEPDPNDRKRILTYPAIAMKRLDKAVEQYSEQTSGVEKEVINPEDVPL